MTEQDKDKKTMGKMVETPSGESYLLLKPSEWIKKVQEEERK